MYKFVCTGTPEHTSYSASKEQHDPSCPTCGAPTIEVRELDQHPLKVEGGEEMDRAVTLRSEGKTETEIAEIMGISVTDLRFVFNHYQVELGKATRKTANEMKKNGRSNAEIGAEIGLSENSVRMILEPPELKEEETIWFPGIYTGRENVWGYTRVASSLSEHQVIALVQKRAREDGEWAIENNRVGGRPEFMRKMMAWVSDEKNIRQCLKANPDETVDWICRELANVTKAIGGSRD